MKTTRFIITAISFLFVFISNYSFGLTLTVNDVSDLNSGAGTSGTLRWCINQVNAAGPGPHTITFVSGGIGTITLTSSLPVISQPNVTIDGTSAGGPASIIIDAGGGDIARYIFRGNASATNATFRGMTLKNTGYEPFRFDGSPTGVTIENIISGNDSGNFLDNVIHWIGNATSLTIRNYTITDHQNIRDAFLITGTATNVTFDNINYGESDVRGNLAAIRINGVANNVDILNSNFDMDSEVSTDDGNFGFFFASSASTITIDNVTVNDSEVHGLYIAGGATNISITNSVFDNFDGGTGNQMIRFNNVVNELTMTNVDIDLDVTGNIDDGDYGIYFVNSINSVLANTAVLTDVTINRADLYGIRTLNQVNNLTIEGCSFTGNSETNSLHYGIEFDENSQKQNISINNSSFTNLASAAMIIDMDGTGPASNINITNNIISGTVASSYPGEGVWLWDRNAVTDITISGNTIFNNASNGITIEATDGVNITQNSIYNNGQLGIDNQNNSGGNDLELIDGDTPDITSSVNTGINTYDVTFNLPASCTDCDVEFFTNLPTDPANNGRTYAGVATGLSATGNPHTINLNSGGNNTGYWTSTLKVNTGTGSFGSNGSVSEFGRSFPIIPVGPANVATGINLWLKADDNVLSGDGANVTAWIDQSLMTNTVDETVVSNQPAFYSTTESELLNYNPSIYFDGDDDLQNGNGFGDDRFMSNTVPYSFFVVAQDRRTSVNQLRGIIGLGDNGNDPGFDFQTDGVSPNGLNLFLDGSGPGELYGTSHQLYNGNSGGTNVQPQIFGLSTPNNIGGNGNITLHVDGIAELTNMDSYQQGGIGHNVWIGSTNDARWLGNIAEVVVYKQDINTADRQKIESYLAVKYGITLAHNYYASDWDGTTGTTLWTVGGGYDNDITGIGRDDDGFLNQKQSKSVNEDAMVSIGLGGISTTNTANSNTFGNDKDYLLWGNDNASTALQTTELPAAASALQRIGREWKVAENGSVNNLTITFNGISIAASAYDFELFVDTDGDGNFANATVISGGIGSGNEVSFSGVDLNDGDVFTLGFTQPSPGGVGQGLNLWLKADKGLYSNLITNGGFDIPGGTGWIVSGSTTFGSFGPRMVFPLPNGIAYQQFTTTIGSAYNVSYQVGRMLSGAGTSAVRVDVIDVATGIVLGSSTHYKTNTDGYTSHNIRFNATGTNTELRFTEVSITDLALDIVIDNVVVIGGSEIISGNAVPVWKDQSSGIHDALQETASNQGTLTNNTRNFNPGVVFDRTGENFYNLPAGLLNGGNTDYSILSVQTSVSDNQEEQILHIGRDGSTNRSILHQLDGADRFESSWSNNGFWGGNREANMPDIYTATYNNTTGRILRQDGNQESTNTNTGLFYEEVSSRNNYIGRHQTNTTSFFDGDINEIILYNDNTLTGLELLRVESYLAIKYGIALNQTPAQNYLASDGSVLWNATTNAAYGNDIAGIGRDDLSALNQKQSKSVNDDAIVTVALGSIEATNEDNTNSFGNDRDFLLWGNDDAPISNTGSVLSYATDNAETIEAHIQRTWLASENPGVGSVLMEFDLSSVIGTTGDLSNIRLLVDEDGDFSSGATSISPSSVNSVLGTASFNHNFLAPSGNALDSHRGYFFTIGSVNAGSTPLSVELLGMSIESNECSNLIKWATANESDNDYFLLEKSTNLIAWNEVARVPSKGPNSSSQLNYSCRDTLANENSTNAMVYYRLSQFDLDGSQTMLDIQSFQSSCNDYHIKVYPNPSSGIVYIESSREETVVLKSSLGKIMSEHELIEGVNTLDLSNLPSAVYLLSLPSTGDVIKLQLY